MSLIIQGNGGVGPDRLYDYSWTGLLASGDTGVPITIPAHVRELAFQVTGTFGSGTYKLEGSNDGTNYSVLSDINGTAIASTDTTIWRVANVPKYVKPVATAGSSANVTVYLHGSVVG